ncbi:MAG: insulinase family protein [Pseudomonadota bacterium]
MSFRTWWPRGYHLCAFAGLASLAVPALGRPTLPADAPATGQPIATDPAVRSGTLPNGMRYFIMRNPGPTHGLSIRLGIDVGSFEEYDAERGFAHFVEHLAFRTTRSAPDGGLDRHFAPFGIAFGRDQNAATTRFATTYRLDFATADDKGIAAGFRWLRDVADGVIFTDAGVAIERGVVLAEREGRNSPETVAAETMALFQTPGLRTVMRQPAGTTETLAAARADTLRAFYERWYRPENAVLVVVGDQPIETMEAEVRTGFTSWQGKGVPPARARRGAVDPARGLDSMVMAAPALPTIASACRIRPPAARDETEVARTGREIRSAIWRDILDERYKALINAGNSGLLGASIVANDEQEFAATCLITVPANDAWEKGLAAAQAELRRFERDGPTDSEVEAGIAGKRAALRGAIMAANARTAGPLADMILDRSLDRRPILSPRQSMYAFNLAVEQLDTAGVKTAAKADWSGTGPLVTLVLPTSIDKTQPRAAWLRNEQETALTAFADHQAAKWNYTDFGTPGTVASRQEIADPGFVRLRFANGVILNFKQSTLEANGVELRVQFGAGRRELPDDGYFGAILGTGLFTSGGLGRLSASELEESLRETGWQFEFQLGDDFFQFSKSTSKANVEIQLQVFAAFMSDPGFRSVIDERIPGAIDIMYRMVGSRPDMALGEALLATVDPGSSDRLPSKQAVTGLRSADFARLLKPSLTEAPIELTLVGDIDEKTAIRLVAATFGALPARTGGGKKRADVRFTRFPDRVWPTIRTTHTGPADRAAANLTWPTYVAEPSRRREEYALKLVAAVFNNQLRQRVRTELGKSYAPSVATTMPDNAAQGFLAAQLESNPADLDRLIEEARAVAQHISTGAITADEVEAARKPILSSAAAVRARNGWWAGALSGSARNPALTEEATGFEPLMSAITLAEVKAAAATWLTKAPIVTVALPQAAAIAVKPATAGNGKARP